MSTDRLPEIPGYGVQERLGSGGMGEVYRAMSLADRRPVALKIEGEIVALDRGSGLRERFLREARILQDLEHENLPEFYEAGELPDGRLFIAMELLVGRPLSRFARSPLQELVPLLVQAASALQVVSEAGVVHRDVSPDNFFVVEVGGRSVVKLIDFGVSKDLESVKDGLTRVGSFIGKPAYCSPEQTGLLLEAEPVDWRTDLYSFGLTVHFLVLGRLPFSQGNVVELLRARLKEIPRDRLYDIQPERLRRLVIRLLQLKPEARPDSFEEVVAELLHLQSEIVAESARRMEDSWKRRKKVTGQQRRGRAFQTAVEAAALEKGGSRTGETRRSPTQTVPSARRLMAPRSLLILSGAMIAGTLLLFFAGVLRPRSIPGSALILASLAVATVGALRERASRREEAPAVDYIGNPSTGDLLPFSLLVTGDGPQRDVRIVCDDGLAPEEILIGRTVGPRGLHLSSRTVSGAQARIVREADRYLVENLSGSNRTLVNSRPLGDDERRPLQNGDRIEMAEVSIVFRSALPKVS
jgi:serine/threonine protein kinase